MKNAEKITNITNVEKNRFAHIHETRNNQIPVC